MALSTSSPTAETESFMSKIAVSVTSTMMSLMPLECRLADGVAAIHLKDEMKAIVLQKDAAFIWLAFLPTV